VSDWCLGNEYLQHRPHNDIYQRLPAVFRAKCVRIQFSQTTIMTEAVYSASRISRGGRGDSTSSSEWYGEQRRWRSRCVAPSPRTSRRTSVSSANPSTGNARSASGNAIASAAFRRRLRQVRCSQSRPTASSSCSTSISPSNSRLRSSQQESIMRY
jgi:hypothetical protein